MKNPPRNFLGNCGGDFLLGFGAPPLTFLVPHRECQLRRQGGIAHTCRADLAHLSHVFFVPHREARLRRQWRIPHMCSAGLAHPSHVFLFPIRNLKYAASGGARTCAAPIWRTRSIGSPSYAASGGARTRAAPIWRTTLKFLVLPRERQLRRHWGIPQSCRVDLAHPSHFLSCPMGSANCAASG